MTKHLLSPALVTSLPDPPTGMFDVAYAVTAKGMLALLRSDCDVYGNPELAAEARGRLSLFDGEMESRAIEVPLESPFLVLDQLPDSQWVIAASRCGAGETNARLLSPQGELIRRFYLGDAIGHLQCDATGAIWVGYFDEGVSSDFPGLVRFDTHGQVLWCFDEKATGGMYILDCYTLNVSGSNVWTCYYPDFPIVEIGATERLRHWKCPIRGASALAIEDGIALLAGGYDDDRNRLALLDLKATAARIIGEFRFEIPENARGAPSLFQARAETLHVVRQRIWRRTSVSDALAFQSSIE